MEPIMINYQGYFDTGDTKNFRLLPDNSFYINSPCLLTIPPRTIKLNNTYLKGENGHFDAVRILHVYYKSTVLFLLVEDLKTGRIYQLSHIIGEDYPCIWWLLSWEYFENEIIKRNRKIYNDDSLLDFNF